VGALLHHAAAVQDDDDVGVPERSQPVGDQQAGSPGPVLGERPVDLVLRLRVETGAGLVEDRP
jgi:hypothetical protein